MISVRRVVVGPMSGGLFALAILAFAMGAFEGSLRPLVLGSLLAGAAIAVWLGLRYRRDTHPTISHLDTKAGQGEPLEPK